MRFFDWTDPVWPQVGFDIDGESAYDESGTSIALSSDGSRLAVGAKLNDGGVPNSDVGHVRVYDSQILLNVELVSFNAEADGQTAMLSWETASETNNSGFEVQVQKEEYLWEPWDLYPDTAHQSSPGSTTIQ